MRDDRGAIGASIEALIRTIVREEVDARIRQELPRLVAAPSPRPGDEPYASRKQAAGITGYSRRTIDRLIACGKLPAYGPRLDRIKLPELHRMMAEVERATAATGDDAEVRAEVDRLFSDE